MRYNNPYMHKGAAAPVIGGAEHQKQLQDNALVRNQQARDALKRENANIARINSSPDRFSSTSKARINGSQAAASAALKKYDPKAGMQRPPAAQAKQPTSVAKAPSRASSATPPAAVGNRQDPLNPDNYVGNGIYNQYKNTNFRNLVDQQSAKAADAATQPSSESKLLELQQQYDQQMQALKGFSHMPKTPAAEGAAPQGTGPTVKNAQPFDNGQRVKQEPANGDTTGKSSTTPEKTEAGSDKQGATFKTQEEMSAAGYTLGDDGETYYDKNGTPVGRLKEDGTVELNEHAGSFNPEADKMVEEENKKQAAEQQRQQAAEQAANNPKYKTDIKSWYTDFKFEDPSSWIPRVLGALVGGLLLGGVTKNPIIGLLGGAVGFGAGGFLDQNWDTLTTSKEERKQRALEEYDAQQQQKQQELQLKQNAQTVLDNGVIATGKGADKINHAAFVQLRDQLHAAEANLDELKGAAKSGKPVAKQAYEKALKDLKKIQDTYKNFQRQMVIAYSGQGYDR